MATTKIFRVAMALFAWFTFNISMSSLTKWTYMHGQICSNGANCQSYKFPFIITAVHMLFSWVVCMAILSRRRKKGVVLATREQFRKIVPLAAVYSLSLALGNLSLQYIYPSFNQMLASVSPLVTVIMSILLYQKRYNFWTWVSMPVICGGLLVCSTDEVNYNTLGVICVVGATVLRGVKSVMQEQLLDPKANSLDSVSLVYLLAPWTGAFLILLSLIFEGTTPYKLLLPTSEAEKTGIPFVLLLLTLSGANACFLNVSGNQVTAYLGAVMLQILGNVKACLSIIVSAMIFKNPVTVSQTFGVVMCLVGVGLYNWKGGLTQAVWTTPSQSKLSQVKLSIA